MDHFRFVAQGVSVAWLEQELAAKPELWNQNPQRTQHPLSPHKQADDIWLRFNRIPERPQDWDELECINYPAMTALPAALKVMHWLSTRVEGERIGRVVLTRLKPGRSIPEHCDIEQHASYYDRYHIVLQADAGSLFHCGGETVTMKRGECWSFNNAMPHSVENTGSIDRIHLIVDIRSARGIFEKDIPHGV